MFVSLTLPTLSQKLLYGSDFQQHSFTTIYTFLWQNEERIITAAVITAGEKSDGNQLQTLINKSRETGMEIDTVIDDTAYSEKSSALQKPPTCSCRRFLCTHYLAICNANCLSFNIPASFYIRS